MYRTKYKVKLKSSLLMICISVLNEKRKGLTIIGQETNDLNQLLLKLLDVCGA